MAIFFTPVFFMNSDIFSNEFLSIIITSHPFGAHSFIACSLYLKSVKKYFLLFVIKRVPVVPENPEKNLIL